MKISVLCIIFSLFIFNSNCFSNDEVVDSLNINQKKSSDKGFALIFIGGVGIIPNISDLGQYFNTSPVITYGLEVPITKSHNWVVQLHGHFWISRLVNSPEQEIPYYELTESKYCQNGISTVLKWYSPYSKVKWKISLHLGYLFGNLKRGYEGIDSGMNVYYKLNKNINLSLGYRSILHVPSTGSGILIPTFKPLINYLIFELYYNFKL